MLSQKRFVLILLIISISGPVSETIEKDSNQGLFFNVTSGESKHYLLTTIEEGLKEEYTLNIVIDSVTENGIQMNLTGFDNIQPTTCKEVNITFICLLKTIPFNTSNNGKTYLDLGILGINVLSRIGNQSEWTDYNSHDPGYTITDIITYEFKYFNSTSNIYQNEIRYFDFSSGWLINSTVKYDCVANNK